MATLAEECKASGLSSAMELVRLTGTSKETLTNWLKDKPILFKIVLRGARSSLGLNDSNIKDDFDKSKSEYIDYLYLKDDYAKLQEKYTALQNLPPVTVSVPEQQWCFSPEELQEQAKLIEKLTTENFRLSAELQLLKKSTVKDISPAVYLVGKQFTFEWNSIERVIKRTKQGWLFKDATRLNFSEVSFISDQVISFDFDKEAWFVDIGTRGIPELIELQEIENETKI